MHPQITTQESEISPSFNCYSSESITSKSIAKVIHEDEDFEFSLIVNDNVSSYINSQGSTVFPVFNNNLVLQDEVDHEINHVNHMNDVSNASFIITGSLNNLFVDEKGIYSKSKPKGDKYHINHKTKNEADTSPLRNVFIHDVDETSSYSSSSSSEEEEEHEDELVAEFENLPSGTFCVWRPKVNENVMTKCKKSNSTGSGSKRWRIRYLLKRSNSEGKEPMVLSSSKKTDSPKPRRRSSGEVLNVHERFYVERRAEKEVGKRKSYLPYRKDLVGLFGNVNALGKMLPF